jgi:hypothetical protein
MLFIKKLWISNFSFPLTLMKRLNLKFPWLALIVLSSGLELFFCTLKPCAAAINSHGLLAEILKNFSMRNLGN